ICEFWSRPEESHLSPKGCKIVAGGRRPPEYDSIDRPHPEGVQDVTILQKAGTPSGCEPTNPLSGGLRFAPTSGYFLTTLWVARNARFISVQKQYGLVER